MKLNSVLPLVSASAFAEASLIKRDPAYHDYGEIRLSLTTGYYSPWDDTGSGAKADVGLWNPNEYGSFGILGTIAVTTHDDIVNGQRATLMAALNPNQPPTNSSMPALQRPGGWTSIWTDKGSGSNRDGSIWRANCPDGYVSIGDVGTAGYDQPSALGWCVRQDYARQAKYNDNPLWTDAGSGADQDAFLWEVVTNPTVVTGEEALPLDAGTFRVVNFDGEPNVPGWSLSIKVPKNFTQFSAKVPTITEGTIPGAGDVFDEIEQANVTLPLTAFFSNNNKTIINNIANPFATIGRSIAWYVEGVWENASAGNVTRSDEVTYGFSEAKTESMEHTVGISITAKYGTELIGTEVSLNYQFTYSTSSSYSEFENYDKKEEFTVPPNYVTVMFCKRIRIKIALLNGAVLHQDDNLAAGEFHLSGAPLSGGSSTGVYTSVTPTGIYSQYPPASTH